MKLERDGDFDEIWRGTTLHEERKKNLRLSQRTTFLYAHRSGNY
jgi:hypothetical protein